MENRIENIEISEVALSNGCLALHQRPATNDASSSIPSKGTQIDAESNSDIIQNTIATQSTEYQSRSHTNNSDSEHFISGASDDVAKPDISSTSNSETLKSNSQLQSGPLTNASSTNLPSPDSPSQPLAVPKPKKVLAAFSKGKFKTANNPEAAQLWKRTRMKVKSSIKFQEAGRMAKLRQALQIVKENSMKYMYVRACSSYCQYRSVFSVSLCIVSIVVYCQYRSVLSVS